MVRFIATVLLLLSASVPLAVAKDVFAHLMIGNTNSWTPDDWDFHSNRAAQAGLAGFALNIAQSDWTQTQLGLAYDAAEKLGNFKNFISFDYPTAASQGKAFTPDNIVPILKNHSSRPGQYLFNNQPLVSTFEGNEASSDWASIKQQFPCSFFPEYSKLSAADAAAVPGVDGLFSWNAWPLGATDYPPSSSDSGYSSAKTGKPYMKPLSPWFYRHANGQSWLWRGDNLWHLSWSQAITDNPELIEIVTYNDWAESTYIAPNPSNVGDIAADAQGYVTGSNHTAWLSDLQFYISAYKNGGAATAQSPHFTFWHRLSKASACGSDTPCNNADFGQAAAAASDCDRDAIFFTVFPSSTDASPTVTLEMGGSTQTATPTLDNTGAAHGNVSFDAFGGALGPVTVSVSGAGGGAGDEGNLGPVTGEPITDSCSIGWNVFVAGSG
ncbi:MAG: hypothetical protein Q9159_005866 [Coniocarpon cinnabarinum]